MITEDAKRETPPVAVGCFPFHILRFLFLCYISFEK